MKDKTTIITVAITLVLVAIMVGIFAIGTKSQMTTPTSANPIGDKHPDLGQKHINQGDQHAAYNSDLPSSGPHYSPAAPWGIKTTELPDETLVHNLEHGGIEIAYKPDMSQAQVEALNKLVAALPASSKFNEIKAILVPRVTNTRPIELAAWSYTLNLDTVDSAKITEFYNGHLDKGPELVP